MEEIVLKVGQKYKVRGNIFTKNYTLVYTGKISEERFSLAMIQQDGYQGLSYNLYFSVSQRVIELEHATLDVLDLKDESIRLRINER